MKGHRNFGHVGRPSVEQRSEVKYQMGVNATHIVIQWSKPIINLHMTPEQADEHCRQVQAAKQALLEQQA